MDEADFCRTFNPGLRISFPAKESTRVRAMPIPIIITNDTKS
jgi:hypothetical protein